MSHRGVWVLLLLLLPLFRAGATDPGTALQTAAAVKGGMPGLTRAGRGLAEVPRQAAQCLRLPLGLTQMLFSPLPAVTFSEGLRNTGRGVVAPFRLCIAVLEMPYEVIGGLGDAAGGALP
ncbi:MAG: hypothetical protein RBT78_03565 [Kiritimatiellia bacterium]|jgi:hypothetical protein|nr:hypothetical protein [Kiritimatiellia bacterium]